LSGNTALLTTPDGYTGRCCIVYKWRLPDASFNITIDIAEYTSVGTYGQQVGIWVSDALPVNCNLDAGSECEVEVRQTGAIDNFQHVIFAIGGSVALNSQPKAEKLRMVWNKDTNSLSGYAYYSGSWYLIGSRTLTSYRPYLCLYSKGVDTGAYHGGTVKFDNLVFKYGCPDITPTAWTTTSTSSSTTCSTCSTLSTFSTEPPP